MKQLKRCDGYVLPYVLVVFLILSAVSVSICTTSLNNLKAQEAAVKRAQALYEAEGEIEKFVAKVTCLSLGNNHNDGDAAWGEFLSKVKGEKGSNTMLEVAKEVAGSDYTVTLTLCEKGTSVQIDAVLQMTMTLAWDTPETGDTSTDNYRFENISALDYVSYNISYEGGGAG